MSTVVASYATARCSLALPASPVPADRCWRPAVVAFPTSSVALKCRRLRAVTAALPEKNRPAFSIPPTALLYPAPPPDSKERWDIKEEDDHVKLWFQVPGLSQEDLEINASDDLLEIKRKGARISDGYDTPCEDVHGVGSFIIRLLMTKEYDSNNVRAELRDGMLEVTVGKAKNPSIKKVGFGPKEMAQSEKSQDPSKAQSGGGGKSQGGIEPAKPSTAPQNGSLNKAQSDTPQKAGPKEAQADAEQKKK